MYKGSDCPTLFQFWTDFPLHRRIHLQSIFASIQSCLHIESLQLAPIFLFLSSEGITSRTTSADIPRNEAFVFCSCAPPVFIYLLAGRLVSRDKRWVDWEHKSAVAIKSSSRNLFIIQYLVIPGFASVARSTSAAGCVNYLCNLCRLSYWKIPPDFRLQHKSSLIWLFRTFMSYALSIFASLAFRHKIFSRSRTKQRVSWRWLCTVRRREKAQGWSARNAKASRTFLIFSICHFIYGIFSLSLHNLSFYCWLCRWILQGKISYGKVGG